MQASRWATKSEPEKTSQNTAPTVERQTQAAPAPPAPLPVESSTAPAISGSSYDYNYSDPSIDPFAQTAGTDDLFFDDDIVPIEQPVIEPSPVVAHAPEPVEPSPPSGLAQSHYGLAQSQHQPRGPTNGERGGRGAGRGRAKSGRGRGRGGPNAPSNSDTRDKRSEQDKKDDIQESSPAAPTPDAPTTETTSASPTDATSPPTGPKEPKPPTSVRGDRTLTGGPKRSRLTEEELNAKLASMRSKNSERQAAHERAEADQANFEAREAVAAKQTAERKRQLAERQKQDRQNRQQMMGEREKNRLRKLNALSGREWDNEKEEGFDGTGEERRRGAARGAYGGVAPSPRPAASEDTGHQSEDWGNYRDDISYRGGRGGRGGGGRGGRGGRAGRGGARGDHHSNARQEPQHPPAPSDFPELPSTKPAATKSEDSSGPKKLDFPIRTKTNEVKESESGERPGITKQDSFGLPPAGAGGSWADQVEGT